MNNLTQDAIDIAGGLFFGGMNKITSFGMEKSKPSDRCQAAINELLNEDYLTSQNMGKKGVSYHPTKKMKSERFKVSKKNTGLMITQPI